MHAIEEYERPCVYPKTTVVKIEKKFTRDIQFYAQMDNYECGRERFSNFHIF